MKVRGTARIAAVQVVLGGILAGAVILVLSAVYAPGPPVVVCLLAGLLLAAAAQLLAGVTAEQPEPGPAPEWDPPRRPGMTDVVALEAVLRAADGDQDRFDQRVRPLLAGLTEELLRQRTGLRLDTDEAGRERAREAMGPQLWQLLTAPDEGIAASRASVRTWIEEMERL